MTGLIGNQHAVGNPGGKPGRSGPPKNRHAIRHGLRAGRLPKGCAYVRRECDQLRGIVEAAVAEAHGEITILQAALVQTAIRWERHASLAQRWLRLECEKMDATTRLNYSRDIARASAERDKCLLQLGLDKRADDDIWAAFDRQRDRDTLPPAEASPDPAGDVRADAPAAAPVSDEAPDVPIALDPVEASPATPGDAEPASLQTTVSPAISEPTTGTTPTSEVAP